MSGWVREAKDFGEELRKGLEERLVKDALPNVARGLGEYLESEGADLGDRETLRQMSALTLVPFMFRHPSAGYQPSGPVYPPTAGCLLAEDSRAKTCFVILGVHGDPQIQTTADAS